MLTEAELREALDKKGCLSAEAWATVRALPVDVRQRLAADLLEATADEVQLCPLCGKDCGRLPMAGFFDVHTGIGPYEMNASGAVCGVCYPRLDRLLLLAVAPVDDLSRIRAREDFELVAEAAGDVDCLVDPDVVEKVRRYFR